MLSCESAEAGTELIPAARRKMRLFLVYFAPNVGPELFGNKSYCVVPDLRTPHTRGIAQVSIRARMVAICGNTCGKGASDNLGAVGLRAPRIASRDDDAAHCVPRSGPQ